MVISPAVKRIWPVAILVLAALLGLALMAGGAFLVYVMWDKALMGDAAALAYLKQIDEPDTTVSRWRGGLAVFLMFGTSMFWVGLWVLLQTSKPRGAG